MPRKTMKLSLTEFSDVVAHSSTSKATVLKKIKANDTYSPATDFYKPFREHVVELHKAGKGRADLKSLLSTLTDTKKSANYPAMLHGYSQWWGRQTLVWFPPPKAVASQYGVDVTVTPELGLLIGGVRHVIKLYTRSEKLTRGSAEVIVRLMEAHLTLKTGDRVAVLDVKRGRLFSGPLKTPTAVLNGLVDAELAYISKLWPFI